MVKPNFTTQDKTQRLAKVKNKILYMGFRATLFFCARTNRRLKLLSTATDILASLNYARVSESQWKQIKVSGKIKQESSLFNSLSHLCPGLNAVTNFTIFRKFRNFRSFRNFRNFRNFGQGFPATLDNQASLNEKWP